MDKVIRTTPPICRVGQAHMYNYARAQLRNEESSLSSSRVDCKNRHLLGCDAV